MTLERIALENTAGKTLAIAPKRITHTIEALNRESVGENINRKNKVPELLNQKALFEAPEGAKGYALGPISETKSHLWLGTTEEQETGQPNYNPNVYTCLAFYFIN